MVATLAYSSKLHAKRAENYKFILYNGLRKIRSEATAKMAVKNNQKRAEERRRYSDVVHGAAILRLRLR